MCGCLWIAPYRDPASNPGMCPDWEWNGQPFGSQAGTQSTEQHPPGPLLYWGVNLSRVVPQREGRDGTPGRRDQAAPVGGFGLRRVRDSVFLQHTCSFPGCQHPDRETALSNCHFGEVQIGSAKNMF